MSAIENFTKGIKILIDSAISKAPYDVTYIGLVKVVEGSNLYTVSINGKTYEHTQALGDKVLSVNDTVRVTFPQNNPNLRFILNI